MTAEGGSLVLEPLVGAIVSSAAAQHSHSAVLGEVRLFPSLLSLHAYCSLLVFDLNEYFVCYPFCFFICSLAQYFELVTRFSRYFVIHPDHIPTVLTAFLSRGLNHPLPSLRSMCCYQFTTFVRALCAHMGAYVSTILAALVPLLAPDPRADSEKVDPNFPHLTFYPNSSVHEFGRSAVFI